MFKQSFTFNLSSEFHKARKLLLKRNLLFFFFSRPWACRRRYPDLWDMQERIRSGGHCKIYSSKFMVIMENFKQFFLKFCLCSTRCWRVIKRTTDALLKTGATVPHLGNQTWTTTPPRQPPVQIRHPIVEPQHPNITKGNFNCTSYKTSIQFKFFFATRRHSISTTVPGAEKSSPHENNNVPVAMKTEDFSEVEKKRNVDLADAESNTVLTGMEVYYN